MRDFFIRAFEVVVHIVVVLMLLGVLLSSFMVLTGSGSGMMEDFGLGTAVDGDPLAALIVLLGGLLYVVILAGALYLGLGIYQNTRKTAQMLEEMRGNRSF